MDKYDGVRCRALSPIRIETIKFHIQYLLVLIVSLVSGISLSFFSGKEILRLCFYRSYTHFSLPFSQCEDLAEVASVVVKYAMPRWIAATVILLFSFSVINHFATQIVLIAEGVKLGFTACMLIRLLSIPSVREYLSVFLCIVYILTSFWLLILLLFYALDLAKCSVAVRSYTSVGRLNSPKKSLRRLFYRYIRYCILLLCIDSIYCLILFFCK